MDTSTAIILVIGVILIVGAVAWIMMQRRTDAEERSKLEGQWSRGDNVSTEDLRLALQRYRSFFDRLLSM
jgi:hypothetical protein